MSTRSRLFAILPAAGNSRRMGEPKLLLPLGKSTVIEQVVTVLRTGGLDRVVVVIRPGDEPLRRAAAAAGAHVVEPPEPPAEMRQSVQFGLDDLRMNRAPELRDGWLLMPADHPLLDVHVLETLLDRWNESDCPILIPTYHGRRGHPVLFRWELAAEVSQIPEGQGLNRLVKQRAAEVVELEVDDDAVLLDLDTPDDYARLLCRWNAGNTG